MSYGNEAVSLEQALAEDAVAPKAKKEKKLKAVKEPKAPKEPKDPNAVRATPVRRMPKDLNATYTVNSEAVAKFTKGNRAAQSALLVDGGTVADFKAAGGEITFFSWFLKVGAVSICE